MNYLWPILLQALAFAVLFAEVLIPSFGLLGVIALGLGAWSWYLILTGLPSGAMIAFAAADMLLVPIAIRYAFRYLGRSPVSHLSDVGPGSGLEEASGILRDKVGREAVAETALRPVGRIRLDDEVFEAQSTGEFIEAGAIVRLTSVSGTGFRVERSSRPTADS